MVTVSGDTPAYRSMGELHFTDAKDNPIVILCFVQELKKGIYSLLKDLRPNPTTTKTTVVVKTSTVPTIINCYIA